MSDLQGYFSLWQHHKPSPFESKSKEDTSSSPVYARPTVEEMLDLIHTARTSRAEIFIPAAFYRLCLDYSTTQLCLMADPSHYTQHLRLDDLSCILSGRDAITQTGLRIYWGTFDAHSCDKCRGRKLAYIREQTREGRIIDLFSGDSSKTTMDFPNCKICGRYGLDRAFLRSARDQAWAELPTIFHLESWNVLRTKSVT